MFLNHIFLVENVHSSMGLTGRVFSEAATHATGKRKNHTTVKCEQTTCSVGETLEAGGISELGGPEIQETPS